MLFLWEQMSLGLKPMDKAVKQKKKTEKLQF